MTTNPFTHKSTLDVDIPGLGTATVTAGVDFFQLKLNATLFGKTYRDEVTIAAGTGAVDISRYASFTAAAERRVTELLNMWAPGWVETTDARFLLAATVEYHNRINASTVERDIREAQQHLDELRAIAARLADNPTEYVSPYTTTYRLTDRDR